jgi:hypothetical protein
MGLCGARCFGQVRDLGASCGQRTDCSPENAAAKLTLSALCKTLEPRPCQTLLTPRIGEAGVHVIHAEHLPGVLVIEGPSGSSILHEPPYFLTEAAAGFTASAPGEPVRQPQHTKIDEYTGFDDLGISHNFSGASFTYSPSFQANAMLAYRSKLSNTWDMNATLDGRYTTASYGDLLHNSLFRVDPYAVFDANITFVKDKRYEISFYVKNLTNKYYWAAAQLYEDSLARYAGRPRTWGVSLRSSF